MLHFTSSERNKAVLNYNGHQYTFKRQGATTNEWRCRQRKCSSTLSLTSDNTIVLRPASSHSCEPVNASKQIIDEAVQRMKKCAREETTTIPKIYTEELVRTRIANPGMVTGFSYPDLRSIDSALYRQRALNFPRLPSDLLALQLPLEWTVGLYGEPFVIFDEFCKLWNENDVHSHLTIFAFRW